MARIVLTCWGSHGDVDPFLALATGLRDRGHDVTIATLAYFRPLIESRGIAFRAIRPEADPSDTALVRRIMDLRRGTEFLLRELVFPAVDAMYEDLLPLLEGADLLVSHPLTVAGPIIAQHRGIPWASVVLAPTSFFSRTDVPVMPPAPWLKTIEPWAPWAGRAVVALGKAATRRWAAPVAALRARLGLPPAASPIFEGQHSPALVLALYSRVLGEPQPDWPANVVVTGPMVDDTPHGTALDPEVDAFLADGAPPVLFTLGSSAVLMAGDFWRESMAATRLIGARALCLVGPGNSAAMQASLPPNVMAIDRAPHSLVMPRASVVVHQCGAGTMAQALRSARPMLAVPWAHDQPDNAYRASRLGVARILPAHRYRADRAARALRALIEDPSYASAAARTAAIVRSEGGVRAACDAIEARFALRA